MGKIFHRTTALLSGLVFFGLLLSGCSCNKEDVKEKYLQSNDIILWVDGETVLKYDPLTWQLGHDKSKNEYRVHSDNMGKYYIVTCSSVPSSEGTTVKANVKWSTGAGSSSRDGDFTVEEISSDGKIRLWCASKKIGATVVSLQ